MPGLFDPLTIQGLTLKNRLVMPPMATHMAEEDGAVLDRHIAHYAARAQAGVGLIVVEHAYVARGGRAGETQLGIHEDSLIPGLRRLADAIRSGGAASAIQITHAGGRTTAAVTGEPVAPSAVADPMSGETPRSLSAGEIEALTGAFVRAAGRAAEAPGRKDGCLRRQTGLVRRV